MHVNNYFRLPSCLLKLPASGLQPQAFLPFILFLNPIFIWAKFLYDSFSHDCIISIAGIKSY